MRLGLLSPAQRPTLDEARPAPFRKADVDDIEVPRNDRLGEDSPRLPRDPRPEVAVREVREDEHLHPRRSRELGRTSGRRVQGLVGALLLLEREGGLVDEHVRVLRRLEDSRRGPCVARENDSPTGPRGAKHLLRGDGCSTGQLDLLPSLQPAEQRAWRDPECGRSLDVEPSRAGRFR
jgi:hypothetical protein